MCVCCCHTQGAGRSPVSNVKRLVTGGGDGLLKIWRYDNTVCIMELQKVSTLYFMLLLRTMG